MEHAMGSWVGMCAGPSLRVHPTHKTCGFILFKGVYTSAHGVLTIWQEHQHVKSYFSSTLLPE